MRVTEEWTLLMSTLATQVSSDALTFLPPAPAGDVCRDLAPTEGLFEWPIRNGLTTHGSTMTIWSWIWRCAASRSCR